MRSGGSAHFHPAPEAVPAILESLGRADVSFDALAATLNTTPEALALWMIRPDIRERLEAIDRVVTWRTRLVASNHLTAAIGALSAILQDFNHDSAGRSTRPTVHASAKPEPDIRAQLLALRRSENARRAAGALIRLANVRPNTYDRVEAAALQPARVSYAHSPTPAHEAPARPEHVPAPTPRIRPRPAPDLATYAELPTEPAPASAPEADQATFDQLLNRFSELAADNPELLETLSALAGSDHGAPFDARLEPMIAASIGPAP